MDQWKILKLDDLFNVAQGIRKKFFKKNNIILLNGEMGSGKTTFLRSVLYEYPVSSPSFLHALYYGDEFIHIDAYTLDENKLFNLCLEDILNEKCIIVEWGDLIFDFIKQLSQNLIIIELKFENDKHFIRIVS